jgi:hypothetical protein
MAIKSLNEIVLELIEYYKASQPDLDTKDGTVARDLFIDAPGSQIALLHDEVAAISNLQSLRLVSGSDLEKLGQNLGATKKTASSSTGIALLTFSSLPANVAVNSGDSISAQNGSNFVVTNGFSVDSSKSNYYRSIATKYQNDLNFLNITDPFAVEVSVRASVPGAQGNISKYSLVRTSIPGVSNVTNVFAFQGGANQEDDTSYRNRVLAIFSGSNIGTALGYKNTALTNSAVQDALVISPGDVLMTRDGTIVKTAEDETKSIVSEGTGGKVDVVVLGSNTNENIDTFIYRDKSNSNDPTNTANDVVLGQITGDENKTITRKRIDNIAAGIVPSQPIKDLLEVTGSLSGGNFIPKSVDSLGRVTGNYDLVKDTGAYAGSNWARDTFVWVSDRVSDFQEDIIKAQFNGQDAATFTDVIEIPTIQQNVPVNNENSTVLNSDRSIVQLLHTPCSNVSRVLNSNTGERYTVTNQNLDNGTPFNNSGRIQISGNTLPSASDILQVDYTWIIDYDAFSDYDGKLLTNNPRSSVDSIDWGLSNSVRTEKVLFRLNADNTFYTGSSSLPISSVISANTYNVIVGTVEASTVINFSDRLAISLSAIDAQIDSVSGIKLTNTEKELYSTASSDGLFLNNRVAVGIDIKYNVSIILPTDTEAIIGDNVIIIYNSIDVFNVTNSNGSFISGDMTVPSGNITGTPSQINLLVTYVSSSQDLLAFSVTNLPISRDGNGFVLGTNTGSKNTVISNCISRQNQTVQKDVSNNFYVTLSLLSTQYSLTAANVITVMNIVSGKEYWNSDGYGTVSVDGSSNYVLTFSGLNGPAVGDQVIVVYKATDISRGQPFTFSNEVIKYNLHPLSYNFSTNNLYCPLNNFTSATGLKFEIIDPTTGLVISSATDGYISSVSSESITFDSISINFSTISQIKSKQIIISNAANINNNGTFNIIQYVNSNSIIISPLTSYVSNNQISVIRLLDNKDLWMPSTSSMSSNTLNLVSSTNAIAGDNVLVIVFGNKTLRQSPTRLAITLTDQLTNSGILTATGTTTTKVSNIIFTATQNGLKQNLLEAMKTFLGAASTSVIGSDKSVVRVLKVEKVLTTTDDQVLSSAITYDVAGTEIYNDLLYSNIMNINSSLSKMDFILPSTVANVASAPIIGDKLRVSFVYATDGDSENIYFTRNGTLYTNKKFALLNKLYVSSGFNSSQSARFTISFFTQPTTGSRYRAFYDYLAPKQNERILIRSNFNQVIADTTFAIESSRPINADVLVREAKEVLVNATLNIVIKTEFNSSAAIVKQNTKDRITSAINTGTLGDVINASDLAVAAQGVDGVDRARIIYFNKNGVVGQKLSLVAEADQFFSANDIIVNQESR